MYFKSKSCIPLTGLIYYSDTPNWILTASKNESPHELASAFASQLLKSSSLSACKFGEKF